MRAAWRIAVGLAVMVVVGYAALFVVFLAWLEQLPGGIDGDLEGPSGAFRAAMWLVGLGAVGVYLASGVPGWWLTRRRWMLWPAPALLGAALVAWAGYGVLNQLGWV